MTEKQEQEALFDWAQYRTDLQLMLHVVNEGRRSVQHTMALKRQGMKPGVPDNLLPKPRGGFHGLYIEMKSEKGGTIREEQKEFIDAVRADGYAAFVCKGFDAAHECVEAYIKEDRIVAARNAEKGAYTWRS